MEDTYVLVHQNGIAKFGAASYYVKAYFVKILYGLQLIYEYNLVLLCHYHSES